MKRRSSRSFGVSGGTRRVLSGRLMPLSAPSVSPAVFACVIPTSTRSRLTLRTTPAIRPSSKATRSPGLMSSRTSGSVTPMWAGASTAPMASRTAGRPRVASLVRNSVSPAERSIDCDVAGRSSTCVRRAPGTSPPADQCGPRHHIGRLHRVGPRTAFDPRGDRQLAPRVARVDQADALANSQIGDPGITDGQHRAGGLRGGPRVFPGRDPDRAPARPPARRRPAAGATARPGGRARWRLYGVSDPRGP